MTKLDSTPNEARARLGAALLGLVALGAVVLLSFPAARSGSSAVGWPPMWLLGLPASAWVTLQLLGLSRRRGGVAAAGRWRRRPGPALQATRRPARRRRGGLAARAAMAAAGLWAGLC